MKFVLAVTLLFTTFATAARSIPFLERDPNKTLSHCGCRFLQYVVLGQQKSGLM